jgi:hypothetical protein
LVVAVEPRVDGTYRAGIKHQLRLCGRRRPGVEKTAGRMKAAFIAKARGHVHP